MRVHFSRACFCSRHAAHATHINFIYLEIQCRIRKLVFYRKRDYRAKKGKLKNGKQFLTNFNIFEWINLSMHAFPQIFQVYVFDISSRMLKVAFPSFKISKFSSGEFPQNPLQVSVSGACLLATPPPPPPPFLAPIQNMLRHP